MTNQAYNLINISSATKAEHLKSYLDGEKEMISMLGADTTFRNLLSVSSASATFKIKKQITDDRLNRTISSDNNINELFLIDKNAKVVASTNQSHNGFDKSTDLFFTEGKHGIYIKDIYFSDITNNLAWGLAAPITDDITKELLGVIVARINVDPFFQILEINSKLGNTWESFLINHDKYFLTPSLFLGNDVILKQKVDTENSRNCFSENSNIQATKIYKDYRNILILGTHTYVPETGWCLITKVDWVEIFSPVITVILLFIVLFILGISIYYFVGKYLTKKITKPIEDLSNGAKIITQGNFDYSVATDLQDEIGQLSRDFDKMTKSIRNSYKDVDRKVIKQTQEISKKNNDLENQQRAILNVLEDVGQSKTDLEKFKSAVEGVSEHIVITDNEGMILYANKAVSKITGFSNAEIMGKKVGNKKLWGGLMPKVFYETLWKTIKTDKKMFSGEVNNMRKNGEKYVAVASISPILDQNGKVVFFVGIERDVTHEKEVDRMKTDFISLASHQLRTPLSAMRWFCEMLLEGDAGKMTNEQLEMVKNIDGANMRMIILVNSLLNISRIESGKIVIDPEFVDLKKVLETELSGLDIQIKAKKQTVKLLIETDLPKIYVDPKLIGEVCKNLLTNAIKYSPVSGKIEVNIFKKEKEVILKLSDNGIGIPKISQTKIFERFYRAENALKAETEGTGLGLYLVKTVIESSGGKVWFESVEGKGSIFYFSLPLDETKKKK